LTKTKALKAKPPKMGSTSKIKQEAYYLEEFEVKGFSLAGSFPISQM
jgi:hypothetical protein